MVARGALGVEIDIAQMAVAQKRIVALCNQRRKPVIIAPRCSDSMTHARIPTPSRSHRRGQCVLDGADACMLSGETAIGEHPVEVVKMMNRIAVATEPIYRDRTRTASPDLCASPVDAITEATVYSAGRIAARLGPSWSSLPAARGKLPVRFRRIAALCRPSAVSDSEATLRRMCLYWGVFPSAMRPRRRHRLLKYVISRTQEISRVGKGDRVVLVTGTRLLTRATT